MKITSIQVRGVLVPMREPHRTASGTVSASPLVLVTLNTDAGVQGHGIVFSYTPAALKPLADLIASIAPLVEDQALAPATVSDALAARFRLLGTQGLVGMALAAIDMAMWDAQARGAGLPLCALLGAAPRPLPAYAGLGFDSPEASARAAEAFAKQGFKGIKAKIGHATVQQDLAVIRALRSAVGPDVALMVDYNQALGPAEALSRLRVLDSEGLAWIEEPVGSHDFAGLAGLAQRLRTPLQAGENWWGPQDFSHAIAAGATTLGMPDAMKVGGVTGWMRVAALGQAHGLSLSSHLWPELSAQLLCATPTAHWLEYADWWNGILVEPLRVEDGMAHPATTAGSGIAFDERAVQRYLA